MGYKYTYDKDADVLSVLLRNEPFDHAIEVGDFVVHVNKKDKPVYLEVLNAKKFLKEMTAAVPATQTPTSL